MAALVPGEGFVLGVVATNKPLTSGRSLQVINILKVDLNLDLVCV